jgi:hypothetical protein
MVLQFYFFVNYVLRQDNTMEKTPNKPLLGNVCDYHVYNINYLIYLFTILKLLLY